MELVAVSIDIVNIVCEPVCLKMLALESFTVVEMISIVTQHKNRQLPRQLPLNRLNENTTSYQCFTVG